MIFFKRFLVLAMMAGIYASSSAHSMFAGFKKALNIACKGASLGIIFLPAWKEVRTSWNAQRSLEESTSVASERVTTFVHRELKKVGVNAPHSVRISFSDIGSATDGKNVYVDPYAACKLDVLLDKKQSARYQLSPEESHFLYLQKGMMQHEAIHIKNKDVQSRNNLRLIAPLIIHCGALACKRLVWTKKAVKTAPTIAQSLLKIPVACANFATQCAINVAYSKYTEQRADNGINNNLKMLCAMQRDFKEEDDLQTEDIKDLFKRKNIALAPPRLAIMKEVHSRFHPSHEARAAQFQKRIDKLTRSA